jgi:phenylalanyl-tRNA synthetase beta chain
MRAPLSWLRDFAPIEGTSAELARVLSSLGLVVEGTEETGPAFPGIVVARVLATRPHPAADRIQLVDVDAGGGEAVQVCCGAFNMKAGDLVPLATVGTVMPSGLEIGRRKMRGEWSNGMLCSAAELKLGPEGPEPAIMLLPPRSGQPGTPLVEALGLQADVVFDLEISPNRPDCFSVAGVARDLAAALGVPFNIPVPPHSACDGVEAANVVVEDDARALCPRFTGTVIENVGSVEAPALIRHRLVLAGMRSINPIVDISNYVMLELGQPNHPYDIDQLRGRGLIVRRARPGEAITTLDGVKRELSSEDCVIADAAGAPVGVGGIMGGEVAEISPSTRTVLLEMANFDPRAISATGKRLGLLSEARTRFERGVDPELPGRAIDRFVELLGPGARRGETLDIRAAPPSAVTVKLRPERVNRLLGTSLSPEECVALLEPLGFATTAADPGRLDVTIPSWRPDCEREVDVIEEIARLYGYDKIARTLPARPGGWGGLSEYQRGRRRVRQILLGAGASEAWTLSFCSRADLERAGLPDSGALEVENPLDQAQSLLRPSLLPGLLGALQFNRERQAGALCLFEVGNVFRHPSPGDTEARPVAAVVEQEQLGLAAMGEGVDAKYAVRIWEVLAGGLRVEGASFGGTGPGERPTMGAWDCLHPGRRAVVRLGQQPVGVLGELAPEVSARYGLPGRVAVVLADLGLLLGGLSRSWQAAAVSRYPAADLDLAFVIGDTELAADVGSTIREAAGGLLESLALFDTWRGNSLGEGRRSLAFRLRLRAGDRTLTEDEVARVRDRVVAAVSERHGGALRGK